MSAEIASTVKREWSRSLELLGRSEWGAATRLAGWSLGDLAAHALWGVSMEADALRRARTGEPGPARGVVAEACAGSEAILPAIAAARDDLVAELEQLPPELDGELHMPYGVLPLSFLLPVFVMEAGVHGSDVSAARAEPDDLAPDVIEATSAALGGMVPLLAAGGSPPADLAEEDLVVDLLGSGVALRVTRTGGRWEVSPGQPEGTGDPQPGGAGSRRATIRGSDSDVLLFALGRRPVSSPGLTVEGDEALAAAFKQLVPGP